MGDDVTSARTLPIGRPDTKVATHVAYEVAAEIDRRAHQLGISRAEFIRDFLTLLALGRDGVMSMYADRLDRMTIFGPSEDQK